MDNFSLSHLAVSIACRIFVSPNENNMTTKQRSEIIRLFNRIETACKQAKVYSAELPEFATGTDDLIMRLTRLENAIDSLVGEIEDKANEEGLK